MTPKKSTHTIIAIATLVTGCLIMVFASLHWIDARTSQLLTSYSSIPIALALLVLWVGCSLWRQRNQDSMTDYFPDASWQKLHTFMLVVSTSIFAITAVSLSIKPNNIDKFIYYPDLPFDVTPSIYSLQYSFLILTICTTLFLMVVLSKYPRLIRSSIDYIISRVSYDWQTQARLAKVILLVFVALLAGISTFQQATQPSTSTASSWDLEAMSYSGAQHNYRTQLINGLQNECFLCTGDRQPIENVTTGDDIGLHAYFVIFTWLGVPATEIAYRNLLSLTVSMLVIVNVLLLAWGYRSMFAGIVFGLFVLATSSIARYSSLIMLTYWVPAGVMFFSGTFILILFERARRYKHHVSLEPNILKIIVLIYAIWGFITGAGFLGRSPTGFMGQLIALFTLIILFWKLRQRYLVLAGIVFFIAYMLPIWGFNGMISFRDNNLDLAPTSETAATSHGFSHAILVGLGYVTNDYNILWNDGIGRDLATERCPAVVYLSSEYYDCIGELVVELVINDPLLFIRSIVTKLESIIQITIEYLPHLIILPALVLISQRHRILLFFIVCILITTIPSLLSVPYWMYLQGYPEMWNTLIIYLILASLSLSPNHQVSDLIASEKL